MMGMYTRNLKYLFGIALTFGIFFYIFSKVEFTGVLDSLRNVNIGVVLMCLVISFLSNIIITSYRWKIILKLLKCPVTFKEALIMKMGGNAITSIFPFKSGEFSRMFYLNRLKGMHYSKSIFSIFSEYLLNFLILCFFLICGIILYFFQEGGGFALISYNSKMCFLVPFFCLQIAVGSRFKDKIKKTINVVFVDFIRELREILVNREILLCTLFYMGAELVNLFILSQAMGIHIPVFMLLLVTPVLIMGSHLLITIAGLGAREFGIAILLANYGIAEKLVSLGMLLSFVEVVFPLLFGALFIGIFTKKLFSNS